MCVCVLLSVCVCVCTGEFCITVLMYYDTVLMYVCELAPHVWRVLQDLRRLVHSMPELSEFPMRMICFSFCSWHVKQPDMCELPLQHNSLQHN